MLEFGFVKIIIQLSCVTRSGRERFVESSSVWCVFVVAGLY